MKPLEVEILVAELGSSQRPTQLFHVAYEGTITDEGEWAVLGGDADTIRQNFEGRFASSWDLAQAVKACAAALSGPERSLGALDLEAATLSDGNGRRTFERLDDTRLASLLA